MVGTGRAGTVLLGDDDNRAVSVSSDNPKTGDDELVVNLLSNQRVIKALVKMVLDKNLKPPFTIGVYSDWGTGKTYFLESMKDMIDKRAVNEPKPLTVMFEAWQHQDDENILISMLLRAHQELPDDIRDTYDISETLSMMSRSFISHVPKITLGIPGFINVTLKPAKAVEKFIELEAAYRRKKFAEEQEQVRLKKRFREVIDALATVQGSDGSGQKRRIIFFIDDLDRCLPEKVVELLEKIKLFLWHPNCVFVLGLDQGQVISAVGKHRGYGDDVAQRYLEKIVNFPFHLPPVRAESYLEFIKDKLPEFDYRGEVASTFADACVECQASLRLMIQLCNSFILNDYLVSVDIGAAYKPKIMAVLTALQVLHQDVFSKLCGRWDSREDNLTAFFALSQEGGKVDGSDGGRALLEPLLGADSLAAMRKLMAAAADAGVGEGDKLLSYVEFLVAESSQVQPVISEPKIWYEDKGMRWYTKDLPVLDSVQAEVSLGVAVAGIKSGFTPIGSVLEIDGYRWRLLHNDNDQKALLITEDIIGYSYLDKTVIRGSYQYRWESCALNKELNSPEWLEEHLPLLSQAGWLAEDGSGQEALGKVFLLSVEEAESYFEGRSYRMAHLLGTNTAYWWWLRSPGSDGSRCAAGVRGVGSVNARGGNVNGGGGVRPALWLNLESEHL